MKNRWIHGVLAFSLILGVSGVSQASAATLGSKCKKANTTSGQLVCKKVGGKLIWQKKVVKTPKPKPSRQPSIPTPAPSPSPTSTAPTPAPVPTPAPTPEPTAPPAPITFDNLDQKWTSVVARNELNSQLSQLTQPRSVVEIISGPNVVASDLEEEKRLLAIAERMFSKYFQPQSYQVVFFSEKDGAWAEQALQTYGGGFPTKIEDEIKKWPNGCNFAFATVGKKGPIYYQCMDTRGRGINDKQTAIHEYFHLVQQKFQDGPMACWLLEGSATYFGVALGVDGSDSSGAAGSKFIQQLAYQYNPGGSASNPPNRRMRDLVQSVEGAIKVLTDLELQPRGPQDNCLSLGAYSAGHIATEALIAVKGFTTYMSFLDSLKNGRDWRTNFELAFGISTQEFYKKLAPYLKSRF